MAEKKSETTKKSKDPAFLFYPNDWLGGTIGMSFEEKGAYMELLMMQFNRGHMEGHKVGQVVGQLWDKIKDKFIQDANGLWYNVRLEEEQNKRRTFTESRRNNLKGNNQYTKKEEKDLGHMEGHKTSHMENENEDVNIIDSIDKLKVWDFKNDDTFQSWAIKKTDKWDRDRKRKLNSEYLQAKIESLVFYCENKNKLYKNYKRALQDWINKDIMEGKL